MVDRQHTITELLQRIGSGDDASLASLVARVHDELHELAEAAFRGQSPGHTLQPTVLVNEVWLRLQHDMAIRARSREQFLALAAQVMRRLLIDHARSRLAAKRGGDWSRVTLSGVGEEPDCSPADLLAIDEALDDLAAQSPDAARVVELRYFAGLTNDEIGLILGTSRGSIDRRWRMARAWLHAALADDRQPGGGPAADPGTAEGDA